LQSKTTIGVRMAADLPSGRIGYFKRTRTIRPQVGALSLAPCWEPTAAPGFIGMQHCALFQQCAQAIQLRAARPRQRPTQAARVERALWAIVSRCNLLQTIQRQVIGKLAGNDPTDRSPAAMLPSMTAAGTGAILIVSQDPQAYRGRVWRWTKNFAGVISSCSRAHVLTDDDQGVPQAPACALGRSWRCQMRGRWAGRVCRPAPVLAYGHRQRSSNAAPDAASSAMSPSISLQGLHPSAPHRLVGPDVVQQPYRFTG
jgi:hypothetical protein